MTPLTYDMETRGIPWGKWGGGTQFSIFLQLPLGIVSRGEKFETRVQRVSDRPETRKSDKRPTRVTRETQE